MGLETLSHPLEFFGGFTGNLEQHRIHIQVPGREHNQGVGYPDQRASGFSALHGHVARKHEPRPRLSIQGPVSQARIAGTQNDIRSKLLVQLLLQGCRHIDMDSITQGLLGAATAQLGFRQRIGRDARIMENRVLDTVTPSSGVAALPTRFAEMRCLPF